MVLLTSHLYPATIRFYYVKYFISFRNSQILKLLKLFKELQSQLGLYLFVLFEYYSDVDFKYSQKFRYLLTSRLVKPAA